MSEFSRQLKELGGLGRRLSDDDRVILEGDRVARIKELCGWAAETIARLQAQCEHKDGQEIQEGDRIVVERADGDLLAGRVADAGDGGVGIDVEGERATPLATWGQIVTVLPPAEGSR